MGAPTDWTQAKREGGLVRRTGSGEFTFNRIYETEGLLIPKRIELDEKDGEAVVTTSPEAYKQGDNRSDVSGLLNSFASLADAGNDPEPYREFGQRWGLLLLCPHGFPFTERSHGKGLPCRPTFEERIADWWRYASSFRALLSLAGRIHKGKKGKDADWSRAWWGNRFLPSDAVTAKHVQTVRDESEGERLARYVRSWLDLVAMQPTVRWDPGEGEVNFTYSPVGLFGHLALELALGVSKSDGLRLCAASEAAEIAPHFFAPEHGNTKFCPTHDDPRLKDRLRKRRTRRAGS